MEKSQFIMSLVEQIDKHGVGPQHKSIIDRCTALVYQEAEETGIIPTLCTLREKLMEQPEEKAREIALSLELFTTGSLDIFGHGSNVDLDKRVVVFNIHDLGEQLKPTGLLVITDTMLNRVTLPPFGIYPHSGVEVIFAKFAKTLRPPFGMPIFMLGVWLIHMLTRRLEIFNSLCKSKFRFG